MKRQFLRSSNRGLVTPGRVVFGGIAVLILILLLVRAFAPDFLIALVRPLWGAGGGVTAAVGNVANTFESVDAVREERDALRRELEAERNRSNILETQLADMARLAGSLSAPQDRIIAGVLVRPPVSAYDTLVIAAGAKKGILVGAGVFGPGGVPLGRIELVSPEYAHAKMYSSPGQTTEGWVGEGRLPITLSGAGSGAFRATVAKDAPIQVGEQVYIPGPGALPIGTVARVDTNPSSPTSQVYVRPMVNPFTITWVAIGEALP